MSRTMTAVRKTAKSNGASAKTGTKKLGKKVGEIYMTDNYDMFRLVQSNRNIREDKVRKLMHAIEHKNLAEDSPIIVDMAFQILDGQHTFEALKRLDKPVYYKVSKLMTEEDIGSYNSLQDKWSVRDVLKHYTELGRREYKIFSGFMKRYGLGYSTTLILLVGNRHSASKSFRSGDLMLNRGLDVANQEAEMICDFGRWAGRFHKTRSFALACLEMFQHPDYSHDRMMSKMEYLSTKLVRCPNWHSYLAVLEEIYNFKAVDKVYFSR